MYKSAVYGLVNGGITHEKQLKRRKYYAAVHRLCTAD